MAGVANEESGAGRSFEGASSGQLQLQCQSGETSEEWRSLEQVENGTPSTSPAYWDSDDDEDGGQKPSELFGKHTWKIDKFSQITKRELRSNAFEVGGYKWYILIYPQGCDVCNHLSLFLCVANHDKLLPGWSHLAQFTIAVVNKDPKKSKYSDTLHRFWKKEHDWGWKKFMELPKVFEGFIEADTLIIKAQVQIIRERTDRPFRCLDCPYRRELVRVYLTNVDGLCRRFLEDQRAKLRKLIENKARWSSFCTFWLGMDQSARQSMSRENAESILKVVVKHFFIEKEVTSTLVMDSLYIGMKALVGQNKGKKSKRKKLEAEQPVPIIHIDEDAFVLVDDVLLLLERAAMEPLPPMDEKGPQNRTKDVAAGEEFSKDFIERDERRLAELGRRTIEIFVLAHIFSSKIEVAYQEAVSLMRQEELIREEEAAWLANGEQKTRRGVADKEKKSKKKQGKNKKNNRKVKDKGRDEKLETDAVLDKTELDSPTVERDEFSDVETETPHEKTEVAEDISDLCDSIDCELEILPLDSKGRNASPVNWDTDTSKPHHPTQACSNETSSVSAVLNGVEGISLSALDDSSSTCSSDSVPHVVISVPQRANLRHHHNNQTTSSPGRTRQSEVTSKTASQPSEAVPDVGHSTDSSQSSKAVEILSQDAFHTLQDTVVNRTKHHVEKDGGTGYMHRVSCSKDVNMGTSVTSPARSPFKSIPSMAPLKLESKINAASDLVMFKNSFTSGPKQVDSSKDVVLSGARGTSVKSPARIPSKIIPYAAPSKLESNINAAGNPVMVKSLSTNGPKQAGRSNPTENGAALKPETQKVPSQKPTEKPFGHQAPLTHYVPVTTDKPSLPSLPVVSRPLSASLGPTFKPAAVSTVSSVGQTAPTLARPVSATGRLGPEQLTPNYVPQSYHNAIMGSHGSSSAYAHIPHNHSTNTGLKLSFPFSNASAPLFSPQNVDRMDLSHPNVSHGMVNQPNILQSGPRIWTEQHNTDMQHFDIYTPMHTRPETHLPSQVIPGSSGRQQSHVTGDEFPHLDIINDLLDDENVIGNEPMLNSGFQNFNNGPQHMNQQFRLPGESGFSRGLVHSTSSCGFEGTRMYHDNGFQNGYGSSTSPYDTVHRASPRPYINGQIDGLVPSQWQMAGSESPYPENNGYPYHHMMKYPNLNVGVNGYTVYRPSNGL